jgi:hypothetical protein
MARGVETRSPFLDYRLVELAPRLPVALKMKVLQVPSKALRYRIGSGLNSKSQKTALPGS